VMCQLTSARFPLRAEVDNANSSRMNMLSGEEMEFHALDSGAADASTREKHLSQFMAQPVLKLKKGAQVMLIKNMDSSLVNGSLGVVQAFMDENTFNVYTRDEETYLQAQRPDGASDDEENAKARKKISLALYKNNTTPGRRWPVVRFSLQDGTLRDLLCLPEDWKAEAPGGEIIAKRIQVPLILAWALSIHKAQGQTIERIKVDLGKVFEKGQAYVALSRATSQAGLQVLRFDPKKVMVHPKVIQFYNNLVTAASIQGEDTNNTQNKAKATKLEPAGLNPEDESDEEVRYMYA
jgi:ATP-dependent DNA helicase PIF1